jgi:DNA-binding NtrC family response regulator
MSDILNDDTIMQANQPSADQADEPETGPASAASVSAASGPGNLAAGENPTLRGILNAAETQVILRALQHTGWNRKRAAALLKISYRGLLYKIRSHSITKPMAGDSNAAD